MSTGIIVAIIIVITVAALGILAGMAARRRRLRDRFGPEYDRVVTQRENRKLAEAELAGRERRVRKLKLRELTNAAQEKYQARWVQVQEFFVDEPSQAIADAQHVVEEVMRERGYPVSGFDQAVADLSVKHARTLDHFRAAHNASEKAAAGQATTEELRVALLHYRELFSELLGRAQPLPVGSGR